MYKYLPILISLSIVGSTGYFAVLEKNKQQRLPTPAPIAPSNSIGNFSKQLTCARLPRFVQRIKMPQPVVIDLSQKQYKGIALKYGPNLTNVLHPKIWETYDHFSTYILNEQGHIFLIPTPFVSIRPNTFELQKNLYQLNSITGKISVFMHFDDIHPSPHNPYGLNAIAYDCADKTLWLAAIDETDYTTQRGIIYQVDPSTQTLQDQIKSIDALALMIVSSDKGKFLLVGAARDNGLYAYPIEAGKIARHPIKLLELLSATEHIRKIKIKGPNHIELQTVPFSYALIAQTAKKDRTFYDAKWEAMAEKWTLKKQGH